MREVDVTDETDGSPWVPLAFGAILSLLLCTLLFCLWAMMTARDEMGPRPLRTPREELRWLRGGSKEYRDRTLRTTRP